MSESSVTPAVTPWQRVVGTGIALSLVVGVILLAFAWPSLTASPRGVPIGIVGEGPAAEQVTAAVGANADDAIELISYEDRDAAVAAVERREAYGAIVLPVNPAAPGAAPEVLKATAGSAQVAGILDGLAARVQDQVDEQIRAQVEAMSAQTPGPVTIPRVKVTVTDLVPFAESDSTGAGLAVAMFPLVLGGVIGGVVLTLTVSGAVRRVVGVVVYAAAAGLVLAGVLQGWVGGLQGNFWANVLALALAVGAISSTVTGLTSLFGRVGTGLGAIVMVLFANPISAASVPVQFLLQPWGAIGQLLPPGAAGTLLRDLSYFPAADATGPWLLLSVWFVVGLALTSVDLSARRAAARRAVQITA